MVTDAEIKSHLKKLDNAVQDYQERFIRPVIEHKETIHDIFQMALAQDTIKLLEVELELLFADKYPDRYTSQSIDFFKKEKEKLNRRIKAWQDRHFPEPSNIHDY